MAAWNIDRRTGDMGVHDHSRRETTDSDLVVIKRHRGHVLTQTTGPVKPCRQTLPKTLTL